jgi:hypothetical protein
MLGVTAIGAAGRQEGVNPMCLTCGCMDAHLEMGEHNIRYEDVKRAADENGKSVEETFETLIKTRDKDRLDHPAEYRQTAVGTAPSS